jgi:hypothetical protein
VFRQTELEQLQLQKQRLVAQSDANRRAFAAEWRRLQSPGCWMEEAGDFFRRHPLWVATLAASAGTLIAKNLRRPRTAMRRIRHLGKFASLAFAAWKWFGRKKTE